MTRKWMRGLGVLALGMAMVITGCESLSDNALTGPSDKSDILIITTDENGYTIAQETDPTVGVVTASIDQNGGSMNIGSHTLYVPAGAVSAPTVFSMTKLPGEIKVGLTATRLLPNDVGRRGFDKPLTLTLSYANAAEIPNADALKIVWVKLNGDTEVQPSTVDLVDAEVSASLDHFSDYGLGWP